MKCMQKIYDKRSLLIPLGLYLIDTQLWLACRKHWKNICKTFIECADKETWLKGSSYSLTTRYTHVNLINAYIYKGKYNNHIHICA